VKALRSARLSPALLILLSFACPPKAAAHFHALIPDRPAVRPREPASILLFFGHPFESEMADMARPERIRALLPGGSVLDLAPLLRAEKTKDPAGKEVTRFRLSFETSERGDYLVALAAPAHFLGGDEGYVRDFAKVVVHVGGERGWDRPAGDPLEIMPLTRPYGLRPPEVFLARAVIEGKPLEGAEVEIERYNPKPPASLPETEFITRTARTGPGGLIAMTLDAPGWWAITVSQRHGTLRQGEKEGPLTLRATLWVYAGEPLSGER
jgi:nickel transport protein